MAVFDRPATSSLLSVAVLALAVATTTAIPGTYISNDLMNNQRLPYPLKNGVMSPCSSRDMCEAFCVKSEECDAYSYSSFHKICQIYKMEAGTKAVIQNMYKLYVRMKTEDEGYFSYKTDYVKMVFEMVNAPTAQSRCQEMGGNVIAIRDEKLNKLVENLMGKHTIFNAFIGVTDQAEEGKWMYYNNGGEATYQNWDWNGMWGRLDLNCAVIRIDGTWKHTNCLNKFYFVCLIPMF